MSGNPDDWIDEACGEYGTSIDPDTKPHTAMGNAIRAFLAAAERDGVVLVRVPDASPDPADDGLITATQWLDMLARQEGYNAALAAILAGKVTL